MRLLGINYDTGFGIAGGDSSRRSFDPAVVRRELEIIATDLHCDAVRISGNDPDRIVVAAHAAIDAGLQVWFAPFPADLTTAELFPYFENCAREAEKLRARDPATVLVLGCEISLFCAGFIPGSHFIERIATMSDPAFWARPPDVDFADFFAKTLALARKRFGGQITYASGEWEDLDWSGYDFVGVDLYRAEHNAAEFTERLRDYHQHGKPVAITEFGCCAYQGAQDRGGMGWAIVDYTTQPRRINGNYVRDESVQVDYFHQLLDLYQAEGVDSAFWFTFAGYENAYDPNPQFDLDLASYGVVKVLKERTGTAYPGMTWEPKLIFHAMAERYQAHAHPGNPAALPR